MARALKTIGLWCKSRRLGLLYFALFVGILFAVYGVYGLPWGTAGYTALLGLCLGLGFAVYDMYRFGAKQRALAKLVGRFPTSSLPEAADSVETEYTAVIAALEAERARLVRLTEARQNEANQYYTLWVHQVKTLSRRPGCCCRASGAPCPPALPRSLATSFFGWNSMPAWP